MALQDNTTPNYNFQSNPGIMQAYQQMAERKLQQQQMQNQQKQQEVQNIVDVARQTSQLVQSFVEASKQRQQKDAIAAYAEAHGKTPAESMILQQNPDLASKSIIESSVPKASANDIQLKQVVNPDGSMGYASVNRRTGESTPISGLQASGISPDQRQQQLDSQTTLAGARASMADTLSSRLTQTEGDKLANAVDPTKLRDYDRLTAGKRLDQFVQATQGKAIRQQVVEASSLLASMLQGGGRGGVVSEKLIEQLTPSTLKGSALEKLQWLTNHPENVDQQKFIDLFEKTAKREGIAAEDNIRQQQLEALNKHKNVSKDRRNQIMQSIGLSDINQGKDGRFVHTTGTRSILPDYDPYNDSKQAPSTDWQTTPNGIKFRIKG